MKLLAPSSRITVGVLGLASAAALVAAGPATAAPAPVDARPSTINRTASAATTGAPGGASSVAPSSGKARPIIGGSETQAQPYHARVLLNDKGMCTSTLVASRYILTAKHCVDTPGNYTFRIGSTYAESGGTVAAAARITLHPSADLAMVRLDQQVGNAPARLAAGSPQVGSNVSIYGWGATCRGNEGACQSPVLKTATMRMTGFGQDHSGGTALQLQHLNGVAAGGDSGGPAMVAGSVVGVASTSNRQTVSSYTATATYADWIRTQAANG